MLCAVLRFVRVEYSRLCLCGIVQLGSVFAELYSLSLCKVFPTFRTTDVGILAGVHQGWRQFCGSRFPITLELEKV